MFWNTSSPQEVKPEPLTQAREAIETLADGKVAGRRSGAGITGSQLPGASLQTLMAALDSKTCTVRTVTNSLAY